MTFEEGRRYRTLEGGMARVDRVLPHSLVVQHAAWSEPAWHRLDGTYMDVLEPQGRPHPFDLKKPVDDPE